MWVNSHKQTKEKKENGIMARKKKKQAKLKMSYKLLVAILIIALLLCIVFGTMYFVDPVLFKKIFNFNNSGDGSITAGSTVTLKEGDTSVHFMELGNDKAGDCILVKNGNTEILIDAGSDTDSIETISTYINTYCTDGILEYVIVTHGDRDHIACFAGTTSVSYQTIFDRYECEIIIDAPLTSKTSAMHNRYVAKRDAEVANGATHYTALQCCKETDGAKRVYNIADNVSMEILYNYYYDHTSSDENNYSVCMMLTAGNYKYLFTGDLEKSGEEHLVANNSLGKVNVYKAGHHGSKTSSTITLLDVIRPDIVVFTAAMGVQEYTSNLDNVFPTLKAVKNITKYTTNMYCPRVVNEEGKSDLYNGNIVIISDATSIRVVCSNITGNITANQWYKDYRASKLSA